MGPAGECAECRRKGLALQTKLTVNKPGDKYEQEADRIAAAVVSGEKMTEDAPLNAAPLLQRKEGSAGPSATPKSNKDKYLEALKKAGDAFLRTDLGKRIKKGVDDVGKAFLNTLPGKIITGTAAAGALTAIVATNSELPMQLPEIPLDKLVPGLSLKFTYEGRVQWPPSKVMISFKYRFDPWKRQKRKSAESEAEKRKKAQVRERKERLELLEPDRPPDWYWRMRRPNPPSPPYLPELKEKPAALPLGTRQEEEETLQKKEMSGAAATPFVPHMVQNTVRSPGRPLDENSRFFMESRLGYDFSQVRVHMDRQAAESARSVNALAYTVGNHIVFGAGQFEPATKAGRQLIAHELVHTMQQQKRGAEFPVSKAPAAAIFRKSAEHECKKAAGTDTICVEILTPTNQTIDCGCPIGGIVDLTNKTAFLQDDVFTLRAVRKGKGVTAEWTLPPELKRVQDSHSTFLEVHVAGALQTGVSKKIAVVTLMPEGGSEPIAAHLKIAAPPEEGPSAVFAGLDENKRRRIDLRRERRKHRKAFWQERRAARRRFRALDRQSRREQRGQFRQERAERQDERRRERQDYRQQAAALRQERRDLRSETTCHPDDARKITDALQRAVEWTNTAVGKLQVGGTQDPSVRSAFSHFLAWKEGEPGSPPGNEVAQKVIGTLVFARNSMLLADHASFQCGHVSVCDKETGAFTVQGSSRGSVVTICSQWAAGQMRFNLGGGDKDAQAYALLHEFIHLAGPQAANETYYHKRSEWKDLNYAQATGMADAYARIAWRLAR